MSPRVLVVGGGLTSAVTSCLLREELGGRVQLAVWDKARGAGGRMSTSRGPEGCGTVDLGAQYITVTPHFQHEHNRFYSELQSAGVLAPLSAGVQGMRPSPAGTRHLIAPGGTNSVVRHFLTRAAVSPEFGRLVTELSADGSRCAVTTSAGQREAFDAVVLTMPPPQILQLKGTIQEDIDSDLSAGLRAVKFSSRFALGLFFDGSAELGVPWGARYVTDHPVIRYVAVDNAKRGKDSVPPTVVVHTDAKFGGENIEMSTDEMQPILMRHVTELFPDWPAPKSVKCQKWRYSQVTAPYRDCPGHVVLSRRPLVLAAGDAFTQSNVDGCLQSAVGAARAVGSYVAKLTE